MNPITKGLKRIGSLTRRLVTPVWKGILTGGNKEAYIVGFLAVGAMKVLAAPAYLISGVVTLIVIGVIVDAIRFKASGLRPKIEEIRNTITGIASAGRMMGAMFGSK